LGINNLDLVHRGIVEYRADVGSGMIEHEVVDMFVAHAPRDLPMDLNPQEVAAVAWVSIPDLRKNIAANPDRFTPWLRIYLTDHSDRIFDTGV
jgi:isopentenyl-diphosphate delta-isomerase